MSTPPAKTPELEQQRWNQIPLREQLIKAKRSVVLIATTALEMPAGSSHIYGQGKEL